MVLLDLGLPDMEGVKVLRRLREWSDVPVLILSVRDDADEKVAALDAGADDYVTKPFDTAEFLARIRVAQRRSLTETGEPVFNSGSLCVDFCSAPGEARRRGNQTNADRIFVVASARAKCRKSRNPSAITSHGLGREGRKPGPISSGLRHPSAEETRNRRENAPSLIKTEVGIGYRLSTEQ